MPSRWFVPVPGIKPEFTRLEFVHGAFTRWFDTTEAEHNAGLKPYAVSPLVNDGRGVVGVEIATLTAKATDRLKAAATSGRQVRLGNQWRGVGAPRLLHQESWASLAEHRQDTQWRLEFATPVTFRSGDRSSPLPAVATMLRGLTQAWNAWGEVPARETDRLAGAVWVSDLDLASTVTRLRIGRRDGGATAVHVSGCTGTLTIRCDDAATAAVAGPLWRLAAYTGIGSMTLKGFGVTRVEPVTGRDVRAGADRLSGGQAS